MKAEKNKSFSQMINYINQIYSFSQALVNPLLQELEKEHCTFNKC